MRYTVYRLNALEGFFCSFYLLFKPKFSLLLLANNSTQPMLQCDHGEADITGLVANMH